MATERSVLHVLPHPGGGGETYVDLLEEMPGYRFSRVYLAPFPIPSPAIARRVVDAARKSRRHDLVHAHGEVAAGLCLPVLKSRPSVLTLHGLHLVRRQRGIRGRAAISSLRVVLRAASRTICVSQMEFDELVRIVGRKAAGRSVVIRNGVRIPSPRSEAERAAVRDGLGISRNEVVGIWVGSLDERKDPLTAARAANEARVRLLVVGDGPLRADVEREAGAYVHVLGQRRDVPGLLTATDFYVSTSRREGLSLSLLEAMAHSLPCVMTDLPENVETVGDVGIAVARGDATALVAAFRLLAGSEDERVRLSRQARERIADSFEAEAMISRTRAVYDDLKCE